MGEPIAEEVQMKVEMEVEMEGQRARRQQRMREGQIGEQSESNRIFPAQRL